jgi:hypothetical protein
MMGLSNVYKINFINSIMPKKSKKRKGCLIRSGKRHAKRNGKKCSLENVAKTVVLKFPLSRDSKGMYLEYCDLAAHKGLALRPDICNERECTHYHKAYISSETQVYKKKKTRQ